MGSEGPPIPSNDNHRNDDGFEADLAFLRDEIDKVMANGDAKEHLTSLVHKTLMYLRSPNPQRAVVEKLEDALRNSHEDAVATSDHVIPYLDPSLDDAYQEIAAFYAKENAPE